MTETLSLDPQVIIILILGLVSTAQFYVIRRIGNVSRSYARMTVAKARILADGKITLEDPDIIPFVQDTFAFMTAIENLTQYITGLIINHPSTGWIKGYAPQIAAVEERVINELAKDDGQNVTPQVIPEPVQPPTAPPVPTPEQPAQPVSTPAGT
jgi:hypothetical protein